MANKNRAKGKRWERVMEAAVQETGIPVDKVKDGYDDDYSDLILWRDFAVIQCKDAQAKRWTEWFAGLEEQRRNVGALYSVLSVKQKGKAAAEAGLHLVPLEHLVDLLKASKWAYEKGYGS